VGQVGPVLMTGASSTRAPALQPAGGPAKPVGVKPAAVQLKPTTQQSSSKSNGSNTKSSTPSKVEKSTKVEQVGNFTKKTKIEPSKISPGQSRSEYVTYKNRDGKVIRTYKDSYDRGNKFQGRKPLRGGPEGRPAQ
jgi:hypothetical protein